MTRENRRRNARNRARYTGETYQQAHSAIMLLHPRPPFIPDAEDGAQQHVESALLHRLLLGSAEPSAGAERADPLFVAAARPSRQGLRLVVPPGAAGRFASQLVTRLNTQTGPSAIDELSIRRIEDGVAHVTAAGVPAGSVDLLCPWPDLRAGVVHDALAATSAPNDRRLRVSTPVHMSADVRAVLSSLLRRIALFKNPGALEWLFDCHDWAINGQPGTAPLPPAALLADLTAESFGLLPLQLRALAIDTSSRTTTFGKTGTADRGSRPQAPLTRTAVHDARGPAAEQAPRSVQGPIPAADYERQVERVTRPYEELVVTGLRLDDAHPIERVYFAMHLPDQWKEPLRQLIKTRQQQVSAQVPLRALNDAIAAVAPGVATHPIAIDAETPRRAWLLATSPVDPRAIFRLVTAWVRAQPVADAQAESTLSQLAADDLRWSPLRIDLGSSFAELSRLLPMHIAAMLVESGAPAPFAGLAFFPCSTSVGAEVMSWPPMKIGRSVPFSITIKITLQTIPGHDKPVANLSFGVRNWMPADGSLADRHSYPVYLTPRPPHSFGTGPARSFGMARIRSAAVSPSARHAVRGAQWEEGLAAVLDNAGYLNLLPAPTDMAADPSHLLWTHHAAGLASGLGASPSSHAVVGLSVSDRAPLMSWVIESVAPHLRPVGPLPFVKRSVYKRLAASARGAVPLEVLRRAIGGRLDIELLTQSLSSTQHALDRLAERLGMQLPPADALYGVKKHLDLGPMAISLRWIPIRADQAAPGADIRSPRPVAHARVDDAVEHLEQAEHPTITLIEAPRTSRGENIRGGDSEVRAALRHKLLRTGRLSYAVSSVDEAASATSKPAPRDSPETARRLWSLAVDDLLRSLGVRPGELPPPAPGSPDYRPALLAISMIRQRDPRTRGLRRQIPVAVLIDPTGQQTSLRTSKMPWRPLHDALIELGQSSPSAQVKPSSDETVDFIAQVLRYATTIHEDTLLLTHAQNLRSDWKFLTNGNIRMDTIGLGGDSVPIAAFPGLRHVRVRTAEAGETPECFGDSGKSLGQPTGLWRYMQPRLFGSTSGKPATASLTSSHVSRIQPGERYGRPVRLSSSARLWNDQFVELLVAGLQRGDDPEAWASRAHELRSAQPFASWATALPWPLQLTSTLGEFLPVHDEPGGRSSSTSPRW